MKKNIGKWFALALSFTLALSAFGGCGANSTKESASPATDTTANSTGAESPADAKNDSAGGEKVFALVSKDVNNPYLQRAYEGFETACKELGVTPLWKGPDQATPEKQIEVINQLVAQNVALIAVSANDYDALQPSLQAAMDKGISVVSFDSAVNADSRKININQADPEKIGRTLVQAAYDMVDGEGGIAILSATAQATNQNSWIEWMNKEIEENPEKYAKTPLITTVYGDDDPTKSTNETAALLKDSNIKVIIAPTTVGMLAAGKYIQDAGSDVKLTGLGLPSEMAPFIEDGTSPWMYLWNPIELGYLAAYAGDALVEGKITGATGDTFDAGNMGEKAVTDDPTGGTEVLLGDPFKFDTTNIEEWKEVY